MKYKLNTLIIALGVSLSLNAQQRVGINKENPDFDLDVKGTMRIENVGGIGSQYIPLGWNPTNNQIVKLIQNEEKPFYKVTLRLKMNNASFDLIKDLDTGIDASKYSAIVTQSNLTVALDDSKKGLDKEPPAFINLLVNYGVRTNDRPYKQEVGIGYDGYNYHSFLSVKDTNNKTSRAIDNWEWKNHADYRYMLATSQANISLTPKRKNGTDITTLHLTADYPDISPVTGSTPNNFVWYITLLVINKELIKTGGITKLND